MDVHWERLREDPALDELARTSSQVADLAAAAGLDAAGHPVLQDPRWAARLRDRTGSDVSVLVVGQVSAGKSTFVNSLLGRKLLPSSSRPTDAVISILQAVAPGRPEYAERVRGDGAVERFASVADGAKFLAERHGRDGEVRFFLDEPMLAGIRLINTPGLGDRLTAYADLTMAYLREDASDLIVWTFFPDSAANEHELGVFADALRRRRGAVLGVITRSLEDHEDDPDHDPRTDPELDRVDRQLRANLGGYLSDVIRYDAFEALGLAARLRADPALFDDPAFTARLDRCGFTAMQQALLDAARSGPARAAAAVGRCAATAAELRRAAVAAGAVFASRVQLTADQATAFTVIERDVIRPIRDRIDHEIGQVAGQYADELVSIMSQTATQAIGEHFTLGGAMRSAVTSPLARIGVGGRVTETIENRLKREIDTLVADRLDAVRFHERLRGAADSVIQRRLGDLAAELNVETAARGGSTAGLTAPVDTSTVVGAAARFQIDAVIQEVLPVLMRAGSVAIQAAGKAVLERAGESTLGTALVAVAGSAPAKALGTVAVVTVPLDIRKLHRDFVAGKESLARAVTAQIAADRAAQVRRIRDTMLPAIDSAFDALRTEARTALVPGDGEHRRWLGLAASADTAAETLTALEQNFKGRAV